ncbi:MAG: nucleotidyl transferase AbiEii/AbiGii toxin family protein [Betaproteobacteria bacterium]|nr:nucleotidyl transferase AbiEii/AbiGii toxin family protein [Betaproteobacteria bacterium]MBI2288818.1 nucleotidyl transferase AbiEii/AbiGii toxin family protein [Betaproteobacteria bacterium]
MRSTGPADRRRPLAALRTERTHSPILNFHYPATQTTGLNYVPRAVTLELGSLTDQQPVGRHAIRPWVAEEFPAAFSDWQCEVTALELARSFWEKATILHAEYHRPQDQPTPDRYARHYADLARLLDHPNAAAFMEDKALAARVVDWKSRVFARGWARYDLARHGSFKLQPPIHRQAALAQDYATMRPMFLTEPPPFAQVMQRLAAAEQTINAL